MKSSITLLGLFFLLAITIFSCKETKKITKEGETTSLGEDEPEVVFKDIATTYSEDTKIIFKIRAQTQMKYPDGNERFPDGIEVDMFTEEGIKKSTLVADSGFYSAEDKVYRVLGNVVVNNLLKEQTLESDVLNWNKDTEEVYTDTKVKITDDCQVTTGTGLKANQDFSEYEILEPEGTAPADC